MVSWTWWPPVDAIRDLEMVKDGLANCVIAFLGGKLVPTTVRAPIHPASFALRKNPLAEWDYGPCPRLCCFNSFHLASPCLAFSI